MPSQTGPAIQHSAAGGRGGRYAGRRRVGGCTAPAPPVLLECLGWPPPPPPPPYKRTLPITSDLTLSPTPTLTSLLIQEIPPCPRTLGPGAPTVLGLGQGRALE